MSAMQDKCCSKGGQSFAVVGRRDSEPGRLFDIEEDCRLEGQAVAFAFAQVEMCKLGLKRTEIPCHATARIAT